MKWTAQCLCRVVWLCMLLGSISHSDVVLARDEGFFSVSGPCGLMFPRDHGPHPGYRVEWWYYTGNVKAPSGDRFGFQLTFFRVQVSPPSARVNWPQNPSAWRTDQLFIGHAALSDLAGRRFFYEEQMARGAAGLAHADQHDGMTKVFLKTWSARLHPSEHDLYAQAGDFTIDLHLIPQKAPVAHGDDGYSMKGSWADKASCYYSFTRLKALGTITLKGKKLAVEGTAWMDHEFSTAPLETKLTGWDWFSIQLEDETELMFYLLRGKEGTYSPASSGTFIFASGETLHLVRDDLRVEVLKRWISPKTRASYPSHWRIGVRPLGLELVVSPNLLNQELVTTQSTQVTYWEGSVSVDATQSGRALKGIGYVEMTGYSEPFRLLE